MDLQQFVVSCQSILGKPVESWLRNRKRSSLKTFTPIWIVGAPRSGTTLTYQLLCRYFKGYYLTNRVAKRYRISLLTRSVERLLYSDSPIPTSFQSKFGNTIAPEDPHEGGHFFYQFFPKENPYSTPEDLSEEQKKNFQNLIEAISSPQELFISKNTFHSLRVQVLSEVFPQSVFIWVRRETDATVYSILKVREKLDIPDSEWWGIKPPGWETENSRPVIDKTIWQVQKSERIIETDFKKMKVPFIEVSYKQLCEAPSEVLEEIAEKFGLQKFRREVNNIPESFTYSTVPEDALLKKIKKALA